MSRVVYRTNCRICGNPSLTSVFDLGKQFLQGQFVKEGISDPPKRTVPLELVWCDVTKNQSACGLLQLSNTVPSSILYSKYWYRSATNTTMRNHLKSIVDEIIPMLPEAASILDIGANDGYLLSCYPTSYQRYAVDPSNAIDEISDETIIKIKDVFPTDKGNMQNVKFNAITAIAMMYDLEFPQYFIQSVRNSLRPDGIFVFEMSYMPTMMKMNAFDTICNEHIEYYSLDVIEYLLNIADMKLVNVTLNDTNGGSIRCTATPKTNNSILVNEEALDRLRLLEFELSLDTPEPYKDFALKSKILSYDLMWQIERIVKDGKTIHLYGASTKVNTLLQFCQLDKNLIPYAADRNPDKHNTYTLGTNIHIISEEESRAMKPDYYLVGPWHFRQEILIRERETILAGSTFIFPLPKIEMYPPEA